MNSHDLDEVGNGLLILGSLSGVGGIGNLIVASAAEGGYFLDSGAVDGLLIMGVVGGFIGGALAKSLADTRRGEEQVEAERRRLEPTQRPLTQDEPFSLLKQKGPRS